MVAYIARRVAYLIPTWIGITLLAFFLVRLAPGDAAHSYFVRVHDRQPNQAELASTRARLGLDRPLPIQYLDWLGGAVRGDLGTSYYSGREVTDELVSRFPATLQLATAATLITLVIAIPLGVVAAIRRNSLLDHLLRVAALLGASVPAFWLALLLIIVFSVELQWLPALGRDGLQHLVLPALALALGEAAVVARLMRSSLLEVLGEDYIMTARAKGVPERRVVIRHALRNSLGAVVTEVGMVFAILLAYSAVIEIIFVWPGIGRLAVEAIGQRDYTMLQGFVVFSGTVFVLVSLVVDLVYLWLDPRVALAQGRGVR
ncbi:MAG TPA: nickel ABC transporter permease [Actinomycetota bacterium]|nr:nickel ABC transporter permease [Actinomycetota bacterium]